MDTAGSADTTADTTFYQVCTYCGIRIHLCPHTAVSVHTGPGEYVHTRPCPQYPSRPVPAALPQRLSVSRGGSPGGSSNGSPSGAPSHSSQLSSA